MSNSLPMLQRFSLPLSESDETIPSSLHPPPSSCGRTHPLHSKKTEGNLSCSSSLLTDWTFGPSPGSSFDLLRRGSESSRCLIATPKEDISLKDAEQRRHSLTTPLAVSREQRLGLLLPWMSSTFAFRKGSSRAFSTVKIGNLPNMVTLDFLLAQWPLLTSADYLFILPGPTGKDCGGCCFVNFPCGQTAMRCLEELHELRMAGPVWGMKVTRIRAEWSKVQGLFNNVESFYSRFGAMHACGTLGEGLGPRLQLGRDRACSELPHLPRRLLMSGAFGTALRPSTSSVSAKKNLNTSNHAHVNHPPSPQVVSPPSLDVGSLLGGEAMACLQQLQIALLAELGSEAAAPPSYPPTAPAGTHVDCLPLNTSPSIPDQRRVEAPLSPPSSILPSGEGLDEIDPSLVANVLACAGLFDEV